ncbi:MAG: 16S rRNA (cytosine(967)-C(5))-methyltransferase RsmB [Gammaproteobacteria bacterium]
MARSVRALAAQVVCDVMRGSALDGPLERARDTLSRADDRGLLAALCFGALRHFYYNRAAVRSLLSKPGQKLNPLLEALLIVGIEQLERMRVAPHAAVSETVAAARVLKLKGSAGLTNAILRRYQRERDEIHAKLQSNEEARYNHPKWLLKALRHDWPDEFETIVEANNAPAPMWLRANVLRGTRDDYAKRFADVKDVTTGEGALITSAIKVTPPQPVPKLPGFMDGDVTVQDQAAQLAAHLLAPQPGQRVLDACAAPGGKTGHLLELASDARVVAVDHSAARLARLRDNLQRLGHTAEVVCADLLDADACRELGEFDRVLLDAPCTGSGVIRRHPDIKLLRRADDSAKLRGRQHSLLSNVFARLKPGGELLYVTCSVLRNENDAVLARFYADHPAAKTAPVTLSTWGRSTQYGRQILPGDEESDGFYYARIVKQS